MMTGPSIGPAMVLTVLMRWPTLIVVGALGGVGAYFYDRVDIDQVKRTVLEVADTLHVPLSQTTKEQLGVRTPPPVLAPQRAHQPDVEASAPSMVVRISTNQNK